MARIVQPPRCAALAAATSCRRVGSPGAIAGLVPVLSRATGALSSSPRLQLVATAAIAWLRGRAGAILGSFSASPTCRELRSRIRFAIWLPLVAISLFAIACSYPGSGLSIGWCGWQRWPQFCCGPTSCLSGEAVARRLLLTRDAEQRSATTHALPRRRRARSHPRHAAWPSSRRANAARRCTSPSARRSSGCRTSRSKSPTMDRRHRQTGASAPQRRPTRSAASQARPTCQQSVTVELSAVELRRRTDREPLRILRSSA